MVVVDHLLVIGGSGEELIEGEDDRVFGGFGVIDGGGVGFDAHEKFFRGFFVAEDGEGVVVAFAHLFAVEAGDLGDVVADAGGGHDEGAFAVEVIDFSDEVAGHFEVLFLVFADGDDVGIVEEDVGSHQGGVGEEGVVGGDSFGDFVFVGMAAFEQAHGADGGENPSEFVDLGDGTLFKKDPSRGIKTAGEEVDRDPANVFAKGGGIVGGGHGVVVGDEVKSFAFALGIDGRFDGAEVVSDVETSAGLEAGENAHGWEVRFFEGKRKAKSASIW